ncbi:dihydrodipicolinate synthase family protein [Palleronia sp. KMU-117]|uniref:dihydrodipicolinate synthase family protein n=1 Tax=Palleronia sp. KMU-117 TaxID=3434108 RepID=UPI003D7517AF
MTAVGTYPMLYAFFDDQGRLRADAVAPQVAAAVAAGAEGVAVLGLGTETHKLGRDERRALLDGTLAAAAGHLPVAVTISEGNLPDAIDAAREAAAAGAAWLILQPPRPPASGTDLVAWFGQVAEAAGVPVAIQNAPEFLGIGLTPAEIARLHEAHPNVIAVKAECSALALGELRDAVGGGLRLLNGRAGLELTDNYRAGADGMIPGIETIDLQVAVARAMREGDEDRAETLYRRLLPTLAFIMQGVAQFVLYGKLIAAMRLGLEPGTHRLPSSPLSPRGLAWARRLAADLGPLAH